MIFVNFKTYEQGTGEQALALIRIMEEVSEVSGIKLIPVLQATDIKEAVLTSKLPVWVQHVDSADFGAHTGTILPEAVKEDGAEGTFLNHSEHRLVSREEVGKTVVRAHAVGLKTLVFVGDLKDLELVLKFNPTYVSYEPAELVGSKTTSVSVAKPEVIGEAVELARKSNLPLIVGAGIKTSKDIKTALSLGATGFAVASSIVTASDPKKVLLELVEGYE